MAAARSSVVVLAALTASSSSATELPWRPVEGLVGDVQQDSDVAIMVAAAEGLLLPAEEGPSAFPARGAKAAGQKAAVAEWMTTLNSTGLWPDIDYGNCTRGPEYGFCGDNWRAAEHIYVRVLSMAQVFRSDGALRNSTELASKASLALHGWLTAATHNVNWWW